MSNFTCCITFGTCGIRRMLTRSSRGNSLAKTSRFFHRQSPRVTKRTESNTFLNKYYNRTKSKECVCSIASVTERNRTHNYETVTDSVFNLLRPRGLGLKLKLVLTCPEYPVNIWYLLKTATSMISLLVPVHAFL